jgi:hypothetical protein
MYINNFPESYCLVKIRVLQEHRPNNVEMLISFLLDRVLLNFYALIRWILLLWLCVSPEGHQ